MAGRIEAMEVLLGPGDQPGVSTGSEAELLARAGPHR
jgi:hypothetical protein